MYRYGNSMTAVVRNLRCTLTKICRLIFVWQRTLFFSFRFVVAFCYFKNVLYVFILTLFVILKKRCTGASSWHTFFCLF